MVHAELNLTAGDAAASALLARQPDSTAIVCANDTPALCVMAASRRAGHAMDTPAGVLVIGYGNTEPSPYAGTAAATPRACAPRTARI